MRLGYLAFAAFAFGIACAPAEETTTADTSVIDISGGTPLPGGDTATLPSTVHVVLNEWSVAPSRTTFSPGRVTFHAMNEGRQQHALEVERGDEEWKTDRIAPGGTGAITVDLKPGTYTLYCPVEDAEGNHRQRGMQTTVTVQ